MGLEAGRAQETEGRRDSKSKWRRDTRHSEACYMSLRREGW
jgi:hypothetical protein